MFGENATLGVQTSREMVWRKRIGAANTPVISSEEDQVNNDSSY